LVLHARTVINKSFEFELIRNCSDLCCITLNCPGNGEGAFLWRAFVESLLIFLNDVAFLAQWRGDVSWESMF
jgi:hypothetical protein